MRKMAKKRKSSANGQDSSGATKMNIDDVKEPAVKKSLKLGRWIGHIVWH